MNTENQAALLKPQKQRSSNIELFRIITMLLIVAHHYVVNSGLTAVDGPIYSQPMAWKSIFLLLFGAWGKTGINCFVLITGYFMCKSQITLKKFLKLLFEIEFYRIVIYCVFLVTGYTSFSLKSFVKILLPFVKIASNFTGSYIVFFLCIPFLNKLIKNLTEKQHIYFMFLLSFIYIFLGTLLGDNIRMNYLSWFSVLYLIASYVRMYPKKVFDNVKFWGIVSAISVLVASVSVIVCAWVGERIGENMAFYLVADSNKVLAVVVALSSFMFFKNLKMKNNALINTVAASAFGVLLIHANSDAMRKLIWSDLLKNVEMYSSQWIVVHAVLSVLIIYVVCTVIDYLRIRFIEKTFFNFTDKYFEKMVICYKSIESKLCKKLQVKED